MTNLEWKFDFLKKWQQEMIDKGFKTEDDFLFVDPVDPYEALISEQLSHWKEMTKDASLKEEAYHKFLAQHAGTFLGELHPKIIISKPKLGSEYTPDFVIISDNSKQKLQYIFLELKKPQNYLFSKTGKLSRTLKKAINECLNYRKWITDNHLYAQKSFPGIKTGRHTNFTIKIIIGREHDFLRHKKQLKTCKRKHGIQIESFDSLSKHLQPLKKKYFFTYCSPFTGKEIKQLINPFSKALTFKTWKQIAHQVDIDHFFDVKHRTIYKVLNPITNPRPTKGNIQDTLKEFNTFFKNSKAINRWSYGKRFEVYTRKSQRLFGNNFYNALDIANHTHSDVNDDYFTAFVNEIEKISPYAIYAENVPGKRLQNFFINRGYHMRRVTFPDMNTDRSFLLFQDHPSQALTKKIHKLSCGCNINSDDTLFVSGTITLSCLNRNQYPHKN